MADGNGKGKRPFGPHGEGCECDPDTDLTEQQAHSSEEPYAPYVSIVADDSHPVEILLSGIGASYASAFIRAIETCVFTGEPLSPVQLTNLMAGMMKGHALARESANLIWANIYQQYKNAAAEKQAEDNPSPAQSALQDISELFYRKPEDGDEA